MRSIAMKRDESGKSWDDISKEMEGSVVSPISVGFGENAGKIVGDIVLDWIFGHDSYDSQNKL